MTHHEPGVGGQTLLTLVKRNRTLRLPWNRLRVGSPVLLSPEDTAGDSERGVVTGQNRDSIEVAVDDVSSCCFCFLDLQRSERDDGGERKQ